MLGKTLVGQVQCQQCLRCASLSGPSEFKDGGFLMVKSYVLLHKVLCHYWQYGFSLGARHPAGIGQLPLGGPPIQPSSRPSDERGQPNGVEPDVD